MLALTGLQTHLCSPNCLAPYSVCWIEIIWLCVHLSNTQAFPEVGDCVASLCYYGHTNRNVSWVQSSL